jgi:BirA family biotin operon repressor/biotin-[acetyl-CoA-carboxylase] ligase
LDLVGLDLVSPFGGPVYYTQRTTSTMELAQELLTWHPQGGYLVWAGEQSQGRGRFKDRSWEAPAGEALLFTLVIPWELDAERPPGLLTALALAEALEALGLKPQIKWPNDLLLKGKKASGILAQYRGGFLHLGIGINVSQEQFPQAIQDKAISLLQAGLRVGRKELLVACLKQLHLRLGALGLPVQDLEDRLWGLGRQSSWSVGLGGEVWEGEVRGLDPQGQLLIMTPEGLRCLSAGEASSRPRPGFGSE